MYRNHIIAILIIWALATPLLLAQELLSLERCRQMALQHNENLRIAALQAEQARQQQAATRTLRLPSFSATGTALYQDKDFSMEMFLPTQVPNPITGQLEPNIMINPMTGQPVIGPDGNPVFNMYAWLPLEVSLSGAYILGVALEQPLYTGGKISAGNRMATIGVEMASDNMALQRMHTLVAADNAYYTYVSVLQKVQLAQQAVDLLAEVLQRVRNSQEVGMASRNDLLKVQVEYNAALLNLQKARNGLELSRMDLNRIIGMPFDTPLLATDTLVDAQPLLLAELAVPNISQRPEYRLLEQQVRMSEQNIRMARADYLPTAGLQAGYNHIGGVEVSGTDFSNSSLNVMGSVKIPLFQWGQGVRKVSAARIGMEMQQLELEKNSQLMELEAQQARLNLLLAWERIQMSQTALEQAQENLRVSRDHYELGMETITELLMAQTQWQQAHTDLIEARADYRMKETAWRKASGRFD